MPRWLRLIVLFLALSVGVPAALTACGSDDDATAAPPPIVSPIDHQTYCPWQETPYEVEYGCGNPLVMYPPAPFPIPHDRPVQSPGMSAGDLALLLVLFDHGMGYHSYYYRDWYFDQYIGPAYYRHPGYQAYGYGHRPLVHVDKRTYNTTIIQHVNTRYAADERRLEKTATYTTAGGKRFTGDKAPKSAFSGTNIAPKTKPIGPAGDAPVSNRKTTKPADPAKKIQGPAGDAPVSKRTTGFGSSGGKYSTRTTSRSSTGHSSGGSHSTGGRH